MMTTMDEKVKCSLDLERDRELLPGALILMNALRYAVWTRRFEDWGGEDGVADEHGHRRADGQLAGDNWNRASFISVRDNLRAPRIIGCRFVLCESRS